MRAHVNLIELALKSSMQISINDGDEWSDTYTDRNQILDMVEAQEMTQLEFWYPNPEGVLKPLGWAMIVLGNADNELVADFSDIPWMHKWFEAYQDAYITEEIETAVPGYNLEVVTGSNPEGKPKKLT